jgi:DNA-binding transcriptional LysR family regulator
MANSTSTEASSNYERMRSNQIGDKDLRLLRVFEALLETNSVSRTAISLGVTPSAVSHSLRDLRERLGDPLFVRDGGKLRPTPRALAARELLRIGLGSLQRVFEPEIPFDPHTAVHNFSAATNHDIIYRELSLTLSEMLGPSSGLTFALQTMSSNVRDQLAKGTLDVVLSTSESEQLLALDVDMERKRIISEPYLCLLRTGHPALRSGVLELGDYSRSKHVFVSFSGEQSCVVDDVLASRGIKRDIVVTVPNSPVAAEFVRKTDVIATIPTTGALMAEAMGGVTTVQPPFSIPEVEVYLWWHAQFSKDAAHIWWRNLLSSECARYARNVRERANGMPA